MKEGRDDLLSSLTLVKLIQILGILCLTLYIWFSSVGATYKATIYNMQNATSSSFLEVENLYNIYFSSANIAKIGFVIFMIFILFMFLTKKRQGKEYEELISLLEKLTLIFLTILFSISLMSRHWGVMIITHYDITISLQEVFIKYMLWVEIVIMVIYLTLICLINYLYNKKLENKNIKIPNK